MERGKRGKDFKMFTVSAILIGKEFINITRMIMNSILWRITDYWVI